MNRMRKEELKKYQEARKGLTPAEIEELDRREALEKEVEHQVGLWHGRLFPEEYDFMLDDGVDAKRRSKGINPMSTEYIAKTNSRRADLGFSGYMDESDVRPKDTIAWVREMVTANRTEELARIYNARKASDAQPDDPENTL